MMKAWIQSTYLSGFWITSQKISPRMKKLAKVVMQKFTRYVHVRTTHLSSRQLRSCMVTNLTSLMHCQLQGALPNGMVVAVKKLHNIIKIEEEDFQREIACLIKAKHKNIVRFLGYCSETLHTRKPFEGRFVWADERQMLFCFEYLSKGSLAGFLTGKICYITKYLNVFRFLKLTF